MTSDAASLPRLAGDAGRSGASDRAALPSASRFGIKVKLFIAVCSLAGLTAVASAVAWYVFGDIDRAVTHVTAESLPGMVSALSLAQESSEIAVTAPALMASRNQEERVVEQARLSQRTADLTAVIEDLSTGGLAPKTTARLLDLRNELTGKLEELNAAIERRLDLKAEREARLAELAAIHTRFLDAIEPLVDDSVFDLVISGEQVTAESTVAITDLVEGGVSRLDRLLSINAEANLAAGLLAEAMHVREGALIQPIRERFAAAASAVERNLRQLPDNSKGRELHDASAALLAFGRGERSVFDRRADELRNAALLTFG
ncbi:MAG: hypothetical protein R3322_20185, partial [Kiloniellales bacterium]|nr:hypothetical protein [Kiloniellales bacterium]